MAQTIIDSYSQVNRDTNLNLDETTTQRGQSFTGTGITLASVQFYLKKYGAPTGDMFVYLYSHKGTYGTSSLPDSLLATSNILNASSLSASIWQLITFTFPLPYFLETGTYYCVSIASATGSPTSYIMVGVDSTSIAPSPTHSGNSIYYTTVWNAFPLIDCCFYCYSNQIASAFIL